MKGVEPMTNVDALWKLQEIELKIKEEKKVLEGVLKPQKINEKIQVHKKMKKDCEIKGTILEEQKKKLRNFEQELQEIEYKKQAIRGKLYGGKVNNSKQLEILLKEQEKLEEITGTIDTEVFQMIEDLERMEEKLTKITLEEQGMYETIRKALKDRKLIQMKSEKKIAQLLAEKAEVLKGIDKTALDLYMDIKARKNKPVSLVEGEICTGCHIDLPVIIFTQLRKDRIVTCSNCGRILYYQDREQEV